MTGTELVQEIIDKALKGKAQPFIQILYWNDFIFYHKLACSTKLIIKTLHKSANNLFKEYCKDVINEISDVSKLLAYSQILDIKTFYENDLNTIKKMLDDYDTYLGEGNFWYSFLGGRRKI